MGYMGYRSRGGAFEVKVIRVQVYVIPLNTPQAVPLICKASVVQSTLYLHKLTIIVLFCGFIYLSAHKCNKSTYLYIWWISSKHLINC